MIQSEQDTITRVTNDIDKKKHNWSENNCQWRWSKCLWKMIVIIISCFLFVYLFSDLFIMKWKNAKGKKEHLNTDNLTISIFSELSWVHFSLTHLLAWNTRRSSLWQKPFLTNVNNIITFVVLLIKEIQAKESLGFYLLKIETQICEMVDISLNVAKWKLSILIINNIQDLINWIIFLLFKDK